MQKETGEQIAVIANQIVQARHRLDPRQQKVIAWAIGQIARDDTDFLTHRLNVSEFAALTGSASGSLYREMENVTTSLLRTILEIREKEGERARTKFQWLSECKYHDDEGAVEIKFHHRLKPYLLELRTRFTQVRLDRFFKFRSSYTIRFFERLEMQRGLNVLTWKMALEEMRDWLGLDAESYPKFVLFRERVLDAAQRELEAKSDWSFSFETIKVGRRITGVEFTLRPSRSPKNDPARDKWKKASSEVRAQVMASARTRPRWKDMPDAEIVADTTFWQYLGDMLTEVQVGQTALKITD